MSKSNSFTGLKIITNCPMCGFKYDDKKDIKTIDRKDGMITFYLNCSQCKSSVIVAVMTEAFGVSSVSIITDIVENDIRKIDGNSIKYDDVLEMHKFLESK